MKREKETSNDPQNITQKTEDWETLSTNTGVNSCAPEGQPVPAPIVSPVVLLLKDTNILWYGNYASKPVYVNKCKKKHKPHAPTKQIRGKRNRISSFRGNRASTYFKANSDIATEKLFQYATFTFRVRYVTKNKAINLQLVIGWYNEETGI